MHLRLLAAILSFGILAACLLSVLWIWKREISPEIKVREQLAMATAAPPPDPGIRMFEKATVLLEAGEFDAARTNLLQLVRDYPDSARFDEAKRVIGEINIDGVLSGRAMVGKKNYIVQRGDSLALIARRQNCTVDYIVQATGLLGKTIHPGDQLTVLPLEFALVVDADAETATLTRKGRFFKEYRIEELRLPRGTRIPLETTAKSKAAYAGGKRVTATSRAYGTAEKWILTGRPGLRFLPSTRLVDENPEEKEPGVYLRIPDLEEINCLLPTGSPVKVIR